jgi:hypothetical protein
MLQHTFCHIPGISQKTEEQLWENQIYTWEDFENNHSLISFLSDKKKQVILQELYFSKLHLEQNNLRYFKELLPPKEHWRCSKHGKIAYLDIETTGLSRWSDEITTIGVYDGIQSKIFVQGIDLEQAKEYLKQFDIIVTFNGKQFDLPFIEHHFQEKYEHLHLDLRYLLKELGFSGGLKKIELALGITRPDEIKNVDGFEAVRLWRRYKQGDVQALETLKQYNKEDIENLHYLLEYYIQEKEKNCCVQLQEIQLK